MCRGGYLILLQLFLSVKTETNKSYCLFVGPVVHEFDHLVELSGGLGREVLMGVGDRVASVIMLTFTKRPGPHADFYKEARPPC